MNNNNLFKKTVPSNMPSFSCTDPFSRFQPMSTFTSSNSTYTTAFDSGHTILPKPNYSNPNTLLHNNVRNNVLDEHITEYKIFIDSSDRDINHFLNPFSYKVTFAPPGTSTYKSEQWIDPMDQSKGTRIVTETLGQIPTPHINVDFRNVKYIKLDNIVLPRYTQVENDGSALITTSASSITDDRFVIFDIKEFNGKNIYSTNYNTSNSFGLITVDKLIIGSNFFVGTPFYSSLLFDDSKLGNISTLTISFKNSLGNQLDITDSTGNSILDKSLSDITDYRHPLHPSHQNHITLLIGVVEPQINLEPEFSRGRNYKF